QRCGVSWNGPAEVGRQRRSVRGGRLITRQSGVDENRPPGRSIAALGRRQCCSPPAGWQARRLIADGIDIHLTRLASSKRGCMGATHPYLTAAGRGCLGARPAYSCGLVLRGKDEPAARSERTAGRLPGGRSAAGVQVALLVESSLGTARLR